MIPLIALCIDTEYQKNKVSISGWAAHDGEITYCEFDEKSLFDFIINSNEREFVINDLSIIFESILILLHKNGYEIISEYKDIKPNTFLCAVSDDKEVFFLNIYQQKGKSKKTITKKVGNLRKIYNAKIEQIAKDFNTEIEPNPFYTHNDNNIYYRIFLENRAKITYIAYEKIKSLGVKSSTPASEGMRRFKSYYGKSFFRDFTSDVPDYELRYGYSGGTTYIREGDKQEIFYNGVCYDCNSMYGYCAYAFDMPYKRAIAFEGKYEYDEFFPLYLQLISCSIKKKPGKWPCFVEQGNFAINKDQIIDTEGELLVLMLTNYDMKNLFENYKVSNLEYLGGYKFQVLPKEKIMPFFHELFSIKENADKNKIVWARKLSKSIIVSTIGKFAQRTKVRNIIPEIIGECVYYKTIDKEIPEMYLPFAIFVNAAARRVLNKAANANIDRLIYTATDCMFLTGTEPPKGIEIDNHKIGAWKLNEEYTRLKIIDVNMYALERPDGSTKIACIGLSEEATKGMKFDEFYSGKVIENNPQRVSTIGGLKIVNKKYIIP